MSSVLNLAPGYEPVLETLFRVVRRQELKDTRPSTSTRIGESCNVNTSYYKYEHTEAGEIIGRDYEKGGEAGWVENVRLAGYSTGSVDI